MGHAKHNPRLHPAMIWLFLLSTLTVRAFASHTLVFSFDGTNGSDPYGVLVADSAGNLYGTTYSGGSSNAGTIFELVAATGYSETVLHSFTGFSDGGYPLAGLVIDPSGNLYGTASCGGLGSHCVDGSGGAGLVFKFSPSTGYSVLYAFPGGTDGCSPTASPDGCKPTASLIFDGAMNLYGTTMQGGKGTCIEVAGCGVVFELTAASSYHLEDVIHKFSGSDGANPKAPVIFNASQTMLYGTTYQGGIGTCPGPASGCGVAFQLTLSGTETILHRFTGGSDGSLPVAPVIFDQTATILYGTASAGGSTTCSGGCGTVFRLSGSALAAFQTVHTFAGADGANPTGGLALDHTSPYYLVGTTFAGGADNLGVIFQLQQNASHTYTLIHSFSGAPGDGANPFAGMLLGIAPSADDPITPLNKLCPSRGCAGCSVGGGELGLGSVFSD